MIFKLPLSTHHIHKRIKPASQNTPKAFKTDPRSNQKLIKKRRQEEDLKKGAQIAPDRPKVDARSKSDPKTGGPRRAHEPTFAALVGSWAPGAPRRVPGEAPDGSWTSFLMLLGCVFDAFGKLLHHLFDGFLACSRPTVWLFCFHRYSPGAAKTSNLLGSSVRSLAAD